MATRPIDEKIVVMKLDNSDFAKKATETTSIFGKLKDALGKIGGVSLGNTTKELGAISQNANGGLNALNGLGGAVETVAGRFTNLGIMATTALTNITNRAVNAGITMAKSLSVDQVSDGFREYELKIGAIGTMLSNTEWAGSTLDDVKHTLGELNEYADQTVYSFADMTTNIGRFTAAGVTLEDSAIAIKGLGNLAAASGSNVEQLGSAMYQSSQALASGKLNLEDWNSLVNAGMAGKKTQDALVATAKAMGKNVDLTDGFRNSIQDGWLTSEVFLKTLQKFGEDESMTKAATSVRTFTGMLASLKEGIGSGWATTWELIFGDFEEATVFWTDFSNTIGSFFAKSTDSRNNFIKGLVDGGAMLQVISGVKSLAKFLGQIFKSMSDGFKRVFPPATVDQILDITRAFRDFTYFLPITNKQMGQITRIFQGAFAIFGSVWEIAKELGKAFLNIIPEGAGGGILDFLENIADMAIKFHASVKTGNALTETIEGFGNVLGAIGGGIGTTISLIGAFGKAIRENLGNAVDWVKEKLAPIGNFFKEAFSGLGGDDILGAGTLVGIGAVVWSVVDKIMGLFDGFGDMVDGFNDTLEGVGDALQNFAMGIKITNLMLIAIAVGILAASLKTLEGIKTEDIVSGLTALAVALGIMIGGMMLMDKFNVTGGLKAAVTIIALAVAVNIMAGALKKLSDLDPDEMSRGIGALGAIVISLTLAMIAISKFGGKIKTGAVQIMALAGAVYVLASAVEKLSEIKGEDLLKGLGALTIIFAELAIFLKVVNKSKLDMQSALGVLVVAGAINLMALAVKQLGGMDIPSLAKGLAGMTIILAEIVIFSQLVKGLNLTVAAAGMLIFAVALNALMIPIAVFANMSMEELAKGLLGMAAALAIVAVAGKLLSGSIAGAVGLGAMAIALSLLVDPIKEFASMTWGEMIKGFVGVAAGIALVAGAALLLSPAVVPMLLFSAALAGIGIAILAVGAGIALFAVGLAGLAVLTATSITAIVASIALLLKGFADLIPAIVGFLVKLGVAIVDGLIALVPKLIEGAGIIIIALLQGIATFLPQFLKLGGDIIVELLNGLGEQVPRIIDAALKFMTDLVNGMAQAIEDNGEALISAIMRLMGEVIILVVEAGTQVISALFGWIPGVSDAMSEMSTTAEKTIRDQFNAKGAGEDKGKDFNSALRNQKGGAKDAGAEVGKAGKDGTNSVDLKTIGGQKGLDFATALGAKTGSASSEGKGLANAGKTGAGSVDMSTTGTNFGTGFASGIGGAYDSVVSKAKSLAKAAKKAVTDWLDIHSPSRVMRKDGGWFGEGFALGIADKAKLVGSKAKALAGTAKDSLNQFLDGFELPETNNELYFKAVIDYDQLDTRKFGKAGSLSITPNTNLTNGLATAAKSNVGQNGGTLPGNVDNSVANHNSNYTINVEAKGLSSRAELRKLAERLQTEMKDLNDRTRISKGQEVAF